MTITTNGYKCEWCMQIIKVTKTDSFANGYPFADMRVCKLCYNGLMPK